MLDRKHPWSLVSLFVGAMSLTTIACSSSDSDEDGPTDTTQDTTTFIGASSDAGTAVAVVTDAAAGGSGEVAVYACDGVAASAWYRGSVANGTLTATADSGERLDATVEAGGVRGTLTLPGGTPVEFSRAPPAAWPECTSSSRRRHKPRAIRHTTKPAWRQS